MSTTLVTGPRKISRDAAWRIINATRTDWRTWLAATLFPFKIYVILAFLWFIKWDFELPKQVSETWFLESGSFIFVMKCITTGYFLSTIVLDGGAFVQMVAGSYRAAFGSILFGVTALIIGLSISSFIARLKQDRYEFLFRGVLHPMQSDVSANFNTGDRRCPEFLAFVIRA
jgi:hypothetical protein